MNQNNRTDSLPKDGWEGFKQNISKDATAGFVVFLLALPLSLGIARASEFPPIMGVLSAIIGGLLATFFTGSKLTIKGPAAGLIVIVAGAVTEFGGGVEGWRLALGVMVVAGLLQILFGLLKWGKYVDIFPLSAVHGMLAAIGLIIIAKQVPVLLNVDPSLSAGKGPLELIASIPSFFLHLDPKISIIGGVSLAIMLFWRFIKHPMIKQIPAPLIVLIFAIPASLYLHMDETSPAYSLVKVGSLVEQIGINVDFSGWSQTGIFIKFVIMVSLVGSLESLLTVKAIDMLDPWHRKSDPNKDIIAVGIANTFTAFLGGIPVISEVARSSANVLNGGRTRWANFFHGLFLLISVLLAYKVLEMIPNAALAAMLITVGIKLAHPKEFISTYKVGSEQLAIFITTIFFTLFEDLLVGIAAGMLLKVVLHLLRGATIQSMFRAKPSVERHEDNITVKLGESAVFTNYLSIKKVLDSIAPGQHLTIDARNSILVDHSVLESLHHFELEYKGLGGTVSYKGLDELSGVSDHPLSAKRRKDKTIAKEIARSFYGQADYQFNEAELIHTLKHYLPSQAALKDFVHHNPLHAFQDEDFFTGIHHASKIFGVQVTFNLNSYRKLYKQGRITDPILERVIVNRKGEEQLERWKHKMLEGKFPQRHVQRIGRLRSYWKESYQFDMDNRVQPILFRIIGSYLDQGIAIKPFPFEKEGLINAIRILESNSFTSFFRSKRAKELLHSDTLSIENLLNIVVGHPAYFDQYIYDQQFGHKGWSGIINAIEDNPDTILFKKKIALSDFILLELLLEIDALDSHFGKTWKPLSEMVNEGPKNYFEKSGKIEAEEILDMWQEAFEWDYFDEVLGAIGHLAKERKEPVSIQPKDFQAIFCIDDRECSLRRHIEYVNPNAETFGAPGFFGAAIYYKAFGSHFYEKNCPAPVTPKHLILETSSLTKRKHEIIHDKDAHTAFKGLFFTFSLGLVAGYKLMRDLLKPQMQPDIADAYSHMDTQGELKILADPEPQFENGIQIGYTTDEMAGIVETLLKGIGLTQNFSHLVYVVAHGSSSANNPHHGAHDCGACSGRPGAVNARVFAHMANMPEVRERLAKRGLHIPHSTQFLGSMHDTASDEIKYYDQHVLSESNGQLHQISEVQLESALDLNAKERARRFASIDIDQNIKQIRNEIKKRSVSYFEPRPELGHGTNAICYVGGREKIKGLFFDRRAFMQSYDYTSDPDGKILLQVISPLPVVCGGISLEYYFSRMDIEKMGAGTKLPHNVMGLIGVANSSDGDLRPGLPLQMVENHDPMRLLMVVEQDPELVLKVIKTNNAIYQWFDKGWVHLSVVDPKSGSLYYFNNGQFVKYRPIKKVSFVDNILKLIQETAEMESNSILDATKENIPVNIYKH
jgi:uncharacterized protein YbcC (UPF0753/DUF2309 family)/MFS superfamily sulfate permease-like transporter